MMKETTTNIRRSAPARRLDLRGTSGGWSFLILGDRLRSLSEGETLEVQSDDEGFSRHLPLVLPGMGGVILSGRSHGRGGRFLIRRDMNSRPQGGEAPPKGGFQMSELISSAPGFASSVDARGSACPGPLLEAKKAIATVKVGEVLEILSSDPGTKDDIPAWAGKVGHEYMGHMQSDGYDRLFVRRRK